jgi:RNA polymerase sigma-70 factor (ECF subfamily)
MVSDEPSETCWTLIRAAARGDAEPREEFARRYLPAVRAYLAARWRRTPRSADVDDGVQEVFLTCLREGGALERADDSAGASFRAFLLGVARKVALHLERTGARRDARAGGTAGSRLPHDDPSLSRVYDRAYAREVMRQAGEAMERRARAGSAGARLRVDLLRLRFEEGLPIREIARRWDVDPTPLHRQYAKAAREFRGALREVVGLSERCAGDRLERECDRLLELLR